MLWLVYHASQITRRRVPHAVPLLVDDVFAPLPELGHVDRPLPAGARDVRTARRVMDIPTEPAGEPGCRLDDAASASRFDARQLTLSVASTPALRDVSFELRAGRDGRLRRAVGLRQDDAREAAGRPLPAERRHDRLQRRRRARCVDLDELRARIGLVTQDTQLFAGTIRENLLFVSSRRDRRRVPRGAARGRRRRRSSSAADRGSTRASARAA